MLPPALCGHHGTPSGTGGLGGSGPLVGRAACQDGGVEGESGTRVLEPSKAQFPSVQGGSQLPFLLGH